MLQKQIYLLLVFFFFSFGVFGQNIAPVVEWQRCFGTSEFDHAISMTPTKDGGYIFVGWVDAFDGDAVGLVGQFRDIWVVKCSALGVIQWQKLLGGSGVDEAKSIVQTLDGGYIILANTTSNNGDIRGNHSTKFDILLLKLSPQGAIQWQKCYGGSEDDKAVSFVASTDGGYFIVGGTSSNDGDVIRLTGDNWVIKVSANGTIQWQNMFGTSSGDNINSACQAADGGYMIIGQTFSPDAVGKIGFAGTNVVIFKLSPVGAVEWQKCYGGNGGSGGGDYGESISPTKDGGFIFSSSTFSNDVDVSGNHGKADAWIVKCSATGIIEWRKCVGGTENELTHSIIQTSDRGFAVVGWTESTDGDLLNQNRFNNGRHGWVLKLSPTGRIEWQKVLGGFGSEELLAINQMSDGSYTVFGETQSTNGDVVGNHGIVDIWMVKLSSEGHVIKGQVNQSNTNCQPSTPPQYFSNNQVKIQKNNATYLVSTDSLGHYGAFVDTGRYTISPVLPNNLWAACPSIETTISTSTRRDTAIVHPSLYVAILCPQMEVQMTTPFLRRCFDNSYTINYANRGTAMQTDATAELTLDTMLTFISATKPVRSRIGNKITFALGNIGVNQAGQFDVVVNVSCNSVLGQTHCSSVLIPKTATCDTVRDTIPTITAQCTITCDSVSFLVKNNGGQTNSTFKYTLIANATALDTGRITLTNTFNLKRKTDGRTYRLELRNINNNQLIAARSIEPPQPPSVSTGFVNQFATINRQINVAENCMANRGAFDPNEKSSVPAGIGTSHLVEQGSLMSYLVQFQNTGTDTAFTVVIRDTLSTLFNLNSLKIQSTSHPATWQLSPNGLLSVRFDNIKLVDSFTNEKKSHGFFTYQIRLKDSIATGTRLENKAAIYFDFNTPIITNYAWHTIGRDFLINCLAKPSINAHFSGCPTKNITFTATSKSSGLTPTYKWFRNSETGPLSINASFTLPNMSNGTKIYCKLTTSSELCTETPMITSDTIVINCINTSTTEITPIQTFDIYPNPNRGVFDVKLSLSKPAMVKLLIVNILGQVLQSNTPTFSTDFFLEKYDISALPNGIYIIKAVVDGQIMMKKVVAQKVF